MSSVPWGCHVVTQGRSCGASLWCHHMSSWRRVGGGRFHKVYLTTLVRGTKASASRSRSWAARLLHSAQVAKDGLKRAAAGQASLSHLSDLVQRLSKGGRLIVGDGAVC